MNIIKVLNIMMLTVFMLSLVSSCSNNEINEYPTTNDKYQDKDIKIVLSDSYIEDSKSYIFSNGIVLVEKNDSAKGIIIAVDSIDTITSEWSKDQSYMIYCDSTYMPIMAKNSQYIFFFTFDNNRKLKAVSVTDINGNILSSNDKIPYMKTKRVSTEGWTAGDDLGAALELYDNIKTIYNPTNSNISSTVASWIVHWLPEGIPQDIASLSISLSDALEGGKLGLLGSIQSYMKLIQDIGENRAKALIGDCTPYIQSVHKEGDNSVLININFSGITSNSKDIPYYVVKYWKEINGNKSNITYTTSPQMAKNGLQVTILSNLNGGRYGIQVILFPSLFLEHDNMMNIYNFRSNIIHFDIARLILKSIRQKDISYSNGKINVELEALLDFPSEQDKEIMRYYNNYGICVSNNNQEKYYSYKENGSLNYKIKLELSRNDFSCDYSRYIATCAGKIYLKTYSIDGYGIKEFYDTKEAKIVYDTKPSISYTSARLTSIRETNRETDDNGNTTIYYTAVFNMGWKDIGTFWMDYAFRKSSDGGQGSSFTPSEGTGTLSYTWSYSNKSSLVSTK